MSNFLLTKKFRMLTALLVFISFSRMAAGQTSVSASINSDEQTIRNMVSKIDNAGKMNFTDDRIFVSGAYPEPMIGKERKPSDEALHEKMLKERLNYKSVSHINRLQVAQAGDIAYEFGLSDLSWDTPQNKHVAFEASYLRVWRKVDGQWKVDVFFARPNGEQHNH